jgi:hypothetical protein
LAVSVSVGGVVVDDEVDEVDWVVEVEELPPEVQPPSSSVTSIGVARRRKRARSAKIARLALPP